MAAADGGSRQLRLERLTAITDVALSHVALDELLETLLERLRGLLEVDTAAVLLSNEKGDALVARAAKGLEEEVERGVTVPVGRGFAGRIAANRAPVFIEDVDHADILNPLLREKGVRSLLGVPLLVEGNVIGVLHVGTLHARQFDHEDTELLQAAADRVAPAIELARLLEAERAARRRLEKLQAVTEAALAHLELDPLLDELLTRVRELIGTDTAAVLLHDVEREELVARAAKGLEEEVERGVRIPVGGGFAGRISADRRPVVIDDIDHAEILNPILREKGIRSLMGVPMLVGGEVLGVLHVGTLTPRKFTQADVDVLQVVADRIAIAIDHTQAFAREREARELAELRAPAAAALEYVGDGVFLLDEQGVIRFWNPAAAAITGVPADIALNRPIREVITAWESVKAVVPTGTSPAIARAEVVPMEIEGREYWLSISGVGFSAGTVYAFRDLTDERRLEEWQTEFIATISHELRTPMASIYGSAQTLLRTDVELAPDLRVELLRIIHGEAERMSRLVADILVASRIQADQVEMHEEPVDAVALVSDVVRSIGSRVPQGLDLVFTAPDGVPPIAADAEKVRHVVSNLVENAIKYSPTGGRVVVEVEPVERYVRFSVHDQGLGIPPHERGRVFERFYRVGAHARLGIGGTGLGLYICRELVRRMHGRLWVESIEGSGSTFRFELPLAGAAAAA